ncbi:MAG: type II toxin-antitoxin system prevent-host-death family antitoxin [Lapillicoccus sp.]
MERVGIRELRQNASALLRRVERGEIIDITNHGHVVGRLVPANGLSRARGDLIDSGDLRPGRGNPLDIRPVTLEPGSPSSAQTLDELREER